MAEKGGGLLGQPSKTFGGCQCSSQKSRLRREAFLWRFAHWASASPSRHWRRGPEAIIGREIVPCYARLFADLTRMSPKPSDYSPLGAVGARTSKKWRFFDYFEAAAFWGRRRQVERGSRGKPAD